MASKKYINPSAEYEDWMNRKWRPAVAWVYIVTCVFDFILFPIGWSILQSIRDGSVTSQWNPLTLQGAGLYHLAMGAVLGIAAWQRGLEKINMYNRYSEMEQYGRHKSEDYGVEPEYPIGESRRGS